MTHTRPDDLWRSFPGTAREFEARFATEEDCRAYWIEARWGGTRAAVGSRQLNPRRQPELRGSMKPAPLLT